MFQAHLERLPRAQKALWPRLAGIPPQFVLYGGTALALRLGHRESLDFDFFSSEKFVPSELLNNLAVLKGSKVLQNVAQTLTVSVDYAGPVKLSFFGGLSVGRVGAPEKTLDGILQVASLLDLAGLKAALVTQRAEAKDYVDLVALIDFGISLAQALSAARALYGESYNPLLTLKALTYFGDGDLYKLTPDQKERLREAASARLESLPQVTKISARISPDE